jgi:hypothetical protein
VHLLKSPKGFVDRAMDDISSLGYCESASLDLHDEAEEDVVKLSDKLDC